MKLAIIWSRSITDKNKVYEIINKYVFKNIGWHWYDVYINLWCKICQWRDKCRSCQDFYDSIDNTWKIKGIISWWAIWVDSLAKEYTNDKDIWYREYSPDDKDYSHLKKHERPLARNTDIVKNSDVILAIRDWYSTGTIRTCNVAKLMGKKVILEIVK